ncbi:Helicase-related_protein [Hexamita inflata]|uniref:Helicase-related protein n=1 Tax=Hexamita inflata TaxID=28002 RepID=A0AA86PCT5_9EUKA|nr:Helicase-related protein [Hexamita inflata]
MSQASDPQESESPSSLSIVFDSSSDQSHLSENTRPESEPKNHQNDLKTFETQKTGQKSTDVQINVQNRPKINESSIYPPEQIDSSSSINILDSSEENGQEEMSDQIKIKEKQIVEISLTDKEIMEQNCRNDQQYVENIYKEAQNQLKLIDEGQDGVEMQKLQQALKELQECDKHFGKQPFYKNQYDSIVNQIKIMLQKEENALNTLQMQNIDQFYKKLTLLNQFILIDIQISVQFDQLVKKFRNSILMVINNIHTQINTSRVEQIICYLDQYFVTLNKLQNITIVQLQTNSVKHSLLNKMQSYFSQFENLLLQDYINCDNNETKQQIEMQLQVLKILNQISEISGNETEVITLQKQANFLIQKWNDKDNQCFDQIQQNIVLEQSLNEYNNISQKIYILQQIDLYRNQQQYQFIYNYCNQNIQQLTNAYTEQLNQYLRQQQFEHVQKYINLLNIDQNMISFISSNINNFIQQVVSQNMCSIDQMLEKQFLTKEELKIVLVPLQTIYEVQFLKNATGQLIFDQDYYGTYITHCITEIYSIIQKLTQFEQVQSNYVQLQQFINTNYDILNLISSFKILMKHKKISAICSEINIQIQKITSQVQHQLKQSLETFKEAKLESIIESGVVYQIKQLQDASKLHAQYHQVYTEGLVILKPILLNQALNLEILDLSDIRELEFNIQQLPQEINLPLLDCLKKIKEQSNEQLQNEIKLMTDGQDFKQLISNFINTTKLKKYSISKQIQEQIKNNIDQTFKKFSDDINNNNFSELFSHIPDIWNDLRLYQNQLKLLQGQKIWLNKKQHQLLCDDNEIQLQCDQIVQQINNSITMQASLLSQNTLSIQQQSKYLTNLIQFMDLIQNNESLRNKFKVEKTENMFQKVIQQIFGIIQNFSIQFNLKLPLITGLDEILENTKKYQQIYFLINQYVQQHNLQLSYNFHNIYTYDNMISKIVNNIQQIGGECKYIVFTCQKTLSENEAERNQFYQTVFQSFQYIINAKSLQAWLNDSKCDVSKIEQECLDQFNKETENIYQQITKQLNKLPCDERRLYKTLNNYCDNLRAISEIFLHSSPSYIAYQKIEELKILFKAQPEELIQLISNQQNMITRLIQYKQMSVDINILRSSINSGIDSVLHFIYQSDNGPLKISEIGSKLNIHTNAQITQLILKEHSKFKNYQLELRNQGSLTFTLDDVLDDQADEKVRLDLGIERAKGLSIQVQDNCRSLVDQPVNRAEIKQMYQEFDTKYWAQVEPYLYKVQDGLDVLKQLVQFASQQKVFSKQNKIDILASVLAYWTLSNTTDYIDSNDKAESRNKLLQPHPAQVVAIFSLLGIDQSNQLKNQLIQVLTGEGKSVILAVTAIVLAIMGFDVNCACYSEYLSQRDYESFTDLFNAFNVRDNIVYGTFNQMCERYINENGEIRKLTEDCILKNKLNVKKNNKMSRRKVLMIDEVDVFFNESFYGSSYTPMARVLNPEIKALIDYVWQNRNEKNLLRKNEIMKSQVYLNCEISLKGWEELLKQALNNILVDIEQFQDQQYIVHEGLIGYKDQDTISTKIFYGYKTLFAYYKEVEKQNICDEELQKRICLYFNCGSFSYAEIPKQYTYIIGVTGTLDTVSKPEMKLLTDEYNIKKFSYLPSVYGMNKLNFAKDSSDFVKIVEQKEYFICIANEINKKRQNKIGIPILVFFETSAKLDLFYNAREYKSIDNYQKIKIFTEKISAVEKEGVVRQAVTQNAVTLITREFGRGTDFICYDKTIDGFGGVHVIQTFFSDELSEEKQIKGRTARQGNNGSYSLVLLDSELEKYGLSTKQIEEMKDKSQLHSTIDPKRRSYFEGKYTERIRNIKQIKEEHNITKSFVTELFDNNIDFVNDFLVSVNKTYSNLESQSKTLIIMDATGSMSGLIDKTKNTIKIMFTNAYAVLQENNFKESFDVMFAAYRNYSSGSEYILQSSPWEAQPDHLKKFIDTIYSRDGEGNEAIEIGLSHAVSQIENGLKQVILIGDMPPNTKEEVRLKRARLGEEYWSTTKYAYPTNYEDQLEILKENNIPVHALYVDNPAQQKFQYIAYETGGKCEALDINSENGAENLTNLITEKIMLNIGGDTLVQKYREKFGHVEKI